MEVTRLCGFRRIITYTRDDENGSSLRGAGWTCEGRAGGRSWNWRGRPRADRAPLTPRWRWTRTLNLRPTSLAGLLPANQRLTGSVIGLPTRQTLTRFSRLVLWRSGRLASPPTVAARRDDHLPRGTLRTRSRGLPRAAPTRGRPFRIHCTESASIVPDSPSRCLPPLAPLLRGTGARTALSCGAAALPPAIGSFNAGCARLSTLARDTRFDFVVGAVALGSGA